MVLRGKLRRKTLAEQEKQARMTLDTEKRKQKIFENREAAKALKRQRFEKKLAGIKKFSEQSRKAVPNKPREKGFLDKVTGA